VRSLASVATTVVGLPFELAIARLMAHSWCARAGLVVPGMYGVFELGRLATLDGATNFMFLAFARLLVTTGIWCGVWAAAEWMYLTPDEWRESSGGEAAGEVD
jgi:hypothetical protein